MLIQEKLKELFSYDYKTGNFIRLKETSNVKKGDIAGCLTDQGYIRIRILGKKYLSHRLAWLYVYGQFPIKSLDHINGNKTDNRIINLREVTTAENLQNQKKPTGNNKTTGLLGASFDKYSNKYKSQICINQKKINLGRFNTPEEAHQAYLTAKRELHSHNTL